MLVYPQIIQILDHIRQFILERLEAALQLEKLRPHLLGKIIDSLLRVLILTDGNTMTLSNSAISKCIDILR